MKRNRILLISFLFLMLLCAALLFWMIQSSNRAKGTPLTYHYFKSLSMERPPVQEPQELEEPAEDIVLLEPLEMEDLSPEEQDLYRFITGQHRVKPGESFSLITGEYWDDIYLWPDLYVRNNMLSDDPDLIFPEEIVDIYNRLGKGNTFTAREKEEILNSYLEVYRIFKSLGARKDNSARALLYTATKYDREFMIRFSDHIDPEDRRIVEQYIADEGYLD